MEKRSARNPILKALQAPEVRSQPYDERDRGSRESVPGLLVRVHPSGKRVFYVQLGRGVRHRIGNHPGWTLDRARDEAKKKIGQHIDNPDQFRRVRASRKAATASTLGGYLDGPFKEHAEANIASHKDMIARLKRNFAALLKKPIPEIGELDLQRWCRGRTGVSLETKKLEYTYLLAAANHAVKTKLIPSHQIGGFKVTGTLAEGEGHTKVRFLTDDEERDLRAALVARENRIRAERASANGWRAERGYDLYREIPEDEYADHLRPLVLLALNTGLRRGDLFSLEWNHLDLPRRQIHKVISKSSHARRKAGKRIEAATLPLSTEAHAVLTQWARQRAPGTSLVFPSPVTGRKLDNVKKAFTEVLSDAGIEGFTFHSLRHSFASRLVMAGVDINTVRELMTHSKIEMTLVYAHLSPDHKAAALEKAFGGTR